MNFSRPRVRRGVALGAAAAVAIGLGVTPSLVADATATASRKTDVPGVTANLFEWNWKSVAAECTDVLGPAGYSGVQVAPPQDSVKRQGLGDGSNTVLHPWWEVYQPVRYDLTSRMGNEAQFKKMVSTCRAAGVKVYVDAVINHMTGQGTTSYGGVSYTKYDYDHLYDAGNFHKGTGQCATDDYPVPPAGSSDPYPGNIADFNNKGQVFNCELVGLSDLRTDTPEVRAKLATYLNKLLGYGVSGFRVDAAKHVGQDDLDAIYAKLHRTKDGTKPYWALEVFGGGPGVLSPDAFLRSGDVLGLDGVKQIKAAFKSYPANAPGSIATLEVFGAGSGLTASAKTLSFVQNHDTERNGDALNYKDGATNVLATQWLLASGYGHPQVYSGFTWATSDDSPPADAGGYVTNTDCSSAAWSCLDRNQGVNGLVGFHNYVGTAAQSNWWDDGSNVISFSRGNRGWASFNNNTTAKTITVRTGLSKGTYCDVVSGAKKRGDCTGTEVYVNYYGKATVTVPAKGAIAIQKNGRV
ncbi:MAG: alpha-amylase [Propionibacteriaceae bacterium]